MRTTRNRLDVGVLTKKMLQDAQEVERLQFLSFPRFRSLTSWPIGSDLSDRNPSPPNRSKLFPTRSGLCSVSRKISQIYFSHVKICHRYILLILMICLCRMQNRHKKIFSSRECFIFRRRSRVKHIVHALICYPNFIYSGLYSEILCIIVIFN